MKSLFGQTIGDEKVVDHERHPFGVIAGETNQLGSLIGIEGHGAVLEEFQDSKNGG
jgi:hypothetical protein